MNCLTEFYLYVDAVLILFVYVQCKDILKRFTVKKGDVQGGITNNNR